MNRILSLQNDLDTFRPRKPRHSHSASRYSLAKTPVAGLFGIAGLTTVEAAGLGLDAAALLEPAITKSGQLTITSDQAQRLLTVQARQKLGNPGKVTYTYPLIRVDIGAPVIDIASTTIEVTWEGNAYGEIGAAYVRRNLKETDAFTKSSLNVSFTKLNRIPPHQMKDPREWPVVFAYDGTYDPFGNGQFEFQGEFEINAFGGLKFNRHVVKSVSLMDFAISGNAEDMVSRKSNRTYTVPPLPKAQKEYLLQHIGNP